MPATEILYEDVLFLNTTMSVPFCISYSTTCIHKSYQLFNTKPHEKPTFCNYFAESLKCQAHLKALTVELS